MTISLARSSQTIAAPSLPQIYQISHRLTFGNSSRFKLKEDENPAKKKTIYNLPEPCMRIINKIDNK